MVSEHPSTTNTKIMEAIQYSHYTEYITWESDESDSPDVQTDIMAEKQTVKSFRDLVELFREIFGRCWVECIGGNQFQDEPHTCDFATGKTRSDCVFVYGLSPERLQTLKKFVCKL